MEFHFKKAQQTKQEKWYKKSVIRVQSYFFQLHTFVHRIYIEKLKI